MTPEEYENQVSDKAEFEYDMMKEEKLIAEYENKRDTQESFNKLSNLWLELTDKNQAYHNKVLAQAFREFLKTEIKNIEESK